MTEPDRNVCPSSESAAERALSSGVKDTERVGVCGVVPGQSERDAAVTRAQVSGYNHEETTRLYLSAIDFCLSSGGLSGTNMSGH